MIAALSSLFVLAAPQTLPPPAPAPAPTSAATTRRDAGAAEPDILISVDAHADQVRWRQVGTVTVRAWSEPGGGVLDQNIATGLPRPIPAQRTFRDVNWSLRAGACVAAPGGADPPLPDDMRCAPGATTTTETGDDPR